MREQEWAVAVLALLLCGCGGMAKQKGGPEERQKARTVVDASGPTWRAAPAWATARPGTTHDEKTGLPEEVMDRETGVELMLVPAGELRAVTPDGTETWKNMRTLYLSKDPVPAAVWGKYMGPDTPYPAVLDLDCEVGQSYFAVILAFDGDREFFARTGFRAPTLREIDHGDAYRASSAGADERRVARSPGFFSSLRVARDP